jgi:hypothetical protein
VGAFLEFPEQETGAGFDSREIGRITSCTTCSKKGIANSSKISSHRLNEPEICIARHAICEFLKLKLSKAETVFSTRKDFR